MLSFTIGAGKFHYRAAAIAIRDNRVMLCHFARGGFYALPGGRVDFGETAADAITREMNEEAGLEVAVERLVWVVENFFQLDGAPNHELGLYFIVHPIDPPQFDMEIRAREPDGEDLTITWMPLDVLASLNLKPAFLKTRLKSIPAGVELIVSDEL